MSPERPGASPTVSRIPSRSAANPPESTLPGALTQTPELRPQTRMAGIVGLGSALPGRRVTSTQIAERLGLADGWIERRTGIHERRYAAADQRVSELAVQAGRMALQDARLGAIEVDLVLVATLAADEITPAAAPIVAHELGATNAGAIDVGAACSGSIAALALGCSWIEALHARHVLVIGAEILTRFLDFDDRRTAPLFGDGAGAIVLSMDADGHVGPFVLGSDGSARNAIRATRSEGVLEMEGHETFLHAVHRLSASTREVVELAGLELADIDLFIFHQANSRVLTAVASRLELPRGRIFDCIAELGNTSAASVPLALCAARRSGALQPGAQVVLGAVGAGMTWGSTVLTWGSS